MLQKVRRNRSPKSVEDELDAFAPRELCRRHEVCVSSHENYGLGLPFQRNRRNVEPDPHINTLLPQGGHEVSVDELRRGKFTVEQPLLWLWLQNPGSIGVLPDFA